MKQFEKLSDVEVIDRILSGEKFLYELIVRRYNPYLYKIGRSYNYNHFDTEDLMQDTYVDAYKGLAQFQKKASVKTWLTRIMLNNCFRKKEKLSFKNEISQEINDNNMPMYSSSTGNNPYKALHSKELGLIIEKTLEHLPEDYRLVFALREMNEFNVAETSELMGISEANVKVKLSRAKEMLRTELEKNYVVKDLYEFNLIYCDAIVEKVMKQIENI
ncbi:MAG: sigma-70 family RNA polymerase sigma factor [Bacteroidetes bacterium]|nr:sigma-70 family RNA polymerase sigma factor [Bacteroidota bacterium]